MNMVNSFLSDNENFKINSKDLISKVSIDKTTNEVLSQGQDENVLNRAVDGLRRFMGFDSHPDDYVKLLGITENKTQKQIYDELYNAGFQNAKTQHNAEAVIGSFFNEASFGIYPDREIVKTDSKVLNAGLYAGKGVSSLAGFVAANMLFKGGFAAVKLFADGAKFANVADKLEALKPFADKITFTNSGAMTFRRAVADAGSLGVLTGLTNLVHANEYTNNVWQAIKDVEPEMLSNALLGAGIPVAKLVKSPVGKILVALGVGEVPRHFIQGQTSFTQLMNGIKSSDTQQITNSIFNLGLEAFMGITSISPETPEAKDIQDGLKDSENITKGVTIPEMDVKSIFSELDESARNVDNMNAGVNKYDDIDTFGFMSVDKNNKQNIHKYEDLGEIVNKIKEEEYANASADGFLTEDDLKQINENINKRVNNVLSGKKDATVVSVSKEPEFIKENKPDPIKNTINEVKKSEKKTSVWFMNDLGEREFFDEGYGAPMIDTSINNISKKIESIKLYSMMGNKQQLTKQNGYISIYKAGVKDAEVVYDAFAGTGLNSNILPFVGKGDIPVVKNEGSVYRRNLLHDIKNNPQKVSNDLKTHANNLYNMLDEYKDSSGKFISSKIADLRIVLKDYLKKNIDNSGAYLLGAITQFSNKNLDEAKGISVAINKKDNKVNGLTRVKKGFLHSAIMQSSDIMKNHTIIGEDGWKHFKNFVKENYNKMKFVIFDSGYVEQEKSDGRIVGVSEYKISKNGKKYVNPLTTEEYFEALDEHIVPYLDGKTKILITNSYNAKIIKGLKDRGFIVEMTERRGAGHVKEREIIARNYDDGGKIRTIVSADELTRGKDNRNIRQDSDGEGVEAETNRGEQKVGTDLFGGVPLKQGFDQAREFIDGHTETLSSKAMSVISWAFINPFHAQYSKNPLVRKVFKAVNDATFKTEKTVERYRTPLFDLTDEFKGMFDTIKDKNLKEAINKAIVDGDKEMVDPKIIFKANYKGEYDEKLVNDIIDKHIEYYDKGRKFVNEFTQNKLKRLLEDKIITESQYEKMSKVMYNELKDRPYYMHRARPVGNITFSVYDSEGKKLYMKPLTDITTWILRKDGNPMSFIANIEKTKWLKAHPEYKESDVNFKTDYIRKADISKLDGMQVIEYLTDVLDDANIDDMQKSEIVNKALDKLKAQGFMSHTIKRSDDVIEGYSEDPLKNMGLYLSQLTGFVEKQEMKWHLNKIYSDVDSKDPVLSSALNRFKEETLRNKDYLDNIVNSTRKFLFVKYLALSLKNGFVNVMFQIPTITAMHTAVEMAKGGKASVLDYGRAEKMMFSAVKDILGKNVTEKETALLDQLDKLGITKSQRTAYSLGKSALLSGAYSKAMDSMGIIQEITEGLNRKTAALSYIRMHPELSENDVIAGARDFIYLTNGKYGDTELSFAFQGKGSLARVARIGQTFQTYVHQMLLGYVKIFGEKQWTALILSAGTFMFLGGMVSMPMYGTMKSAYNAVTGRNMEFDIEKNMGSNAYLYEWLKGGMFANLPFGLSVDVSSSAGMQLPTDELNYMGKSPIEKMGNLVFGVASQSVKDVFKAVDYFEKGDISKAVYYGLPVRFMSYPIKAIDEYYRGLTTNGDLQLVDVDGKPFTLTRKEAFLQGIGFTPERVSEFKDLYYSWKSLKQYWQTQKTDLYNEVRLSIQTGNKNRYRQAMTKMMEVNKHIIEINRDYGAGLNTASVHTVKTIYNSKSFRNFYLNNSPNR